MPNLPFSPLDLITICASLVLFFAATPICRGLDTNHVSIRARMMRTLNFFIVASILLKTFFWPDNHQISSFTHVLIISYFAFIGSQISHYFIRKRFGKQHTSDKQTVISDTYSSRGLSITVSVLIAIITLIASLKSLGFDSLLEAGGVVGLIGIFLAMTQAAWAPDIISGLIILNSRLCEEGDVIEFNLDGQTIISIVFRTKLFHTECLDLKNNHRIMIRNAKLRDSGLHNLSRFASAKGLRECLTFNIGYEHQQSDVQAMFKKAFEHFDVAENGREEQHQAQIRVLETGDDAVTWGVFYYIKEIKSLLTIRQKLRAYILEESNKQNIALSTPKLHIIEQPKPV